MPTLCNSLNPRQIDVDTLDFLRLVREGLFLGLGQIDLSIGSRIEHTLLCVQEFLLAKV